MRVLFLFSLFSFVSSFKLFGNPIFGKNTRLNTIPLRDQHPRFIGKLQRPQQSGGYCRCIHRASR